MRKYAYLQFDLDISGSARLYFPFVSQSGDLPFRCKLKVTDDLGWQFEALGDHLTTNGLAVSPVVSIQTVLV